MNAGELVPYTTAEHMATEYRDAVAKIREHAAALIGQCDRLQEAFRSCDKFDRHHFCIELHYGSERAASIDAIIDRMKLAAWGCIIDKLNIRRLMSSKRIEELDAALGRRASRYSRDEQPTQFPDITPENIQSVAAGMVMSANDFLEEAVAEEYDFWRPSQSSRYKTNKHFWKLGPKVIKSWMVDHWGYKGSPYRCEYRNQPHITALDNIFHMLDGHGPVQEFKGELASAIETSPTGSGETKYFKFKCFANRNLHLTFKRQDLLDRFNQIAAKSDRLGQERRAG